LALKLLDILFFVIIKIKKRRNHEINSKTEITKKNKIKAKCKVNFKDRKVNDKCRNSNLFNILFNTVLTLTLNSLQVYQIN